MFDFLKTVFSIIDKLMNKSNMIGIDQTRKTGITIPELINNIYLCSFPLQLKCLNLIAINGILHSEELSEELNKKIVLLLESRKLDTSLRQILSYVLRLKKIKIEIKK